MALLKCKKTLVWLTGVVGAVVLIVGYDYWRGMLPAASGLTLFGAAFWKRWTGESKPPGDASSVATAEEESENRSSVRSQSETTDELVDQMMAEGRYALLLRPQVIDNLSQEQLTTAVTLLEEHMALVPAGDVLLGWTDEGLQDVQSEEETSDRLPIRRATVAPVFIDRHPVTNEQYQEFVDGGGYEQMAIWDQEIWPAVLDFVDATGHPGPRHWKDGCFETSKADHPVIGVCWYEAAAFARWAGKRIPSDAEWIKAGSWPVALTAGDLRQRRYPWGNSFEIDRANIWGTGPGETVSIEEFADGASIGGVYQMIGNVWEWTTSAYGDPDDVSLVLPAPMKSIRGGAYDTYFENQATCHFQSGEHPISRKHNIGFRLALGACDLAPMASELALVGVTQKDQLATA